MSKFMNRRELLSRICATALTLGVPKTYGFSGQQGGSTFLKALVEKCGLRIGCAAEKITLQNPDFASVVKANFNLLTPGNELKWERLRPSADSYNFADGDWMVNFAQSNGMLVHGHNLCWNSPYNPAWLKSVLTRDNARQYLTEHITTVMKHYAGQIDSWDIVNEPIVSWSQRPDGFYPGPWLNMLGTAYIDIAFRAAAEADPHALRVLNCYNVEQDYSAETAKTRQNTLTLLKGMLSRRVPIQAVGLESHLDASLPVGDESFTQFLRQIQDLGLQVLINELDIDDTKIEGDLAHRDQVVGKTYADYITQVVQAGHLNSLIFWTISDKFNWLNSQKLPAKFHRADGQLHRSGLVDQQMNIKPAYQAIAAALRVVCH